MRNSPRTNPLTAIYKRLEVFIKETSVYARNKCYDQRYYSSILTGLASCTHFTNISEQSVLKFRQILRLSRAFVSGGLEMK